jgi:hypothetical protein
MNDYVLWTFQYRVGGGPPTMRIVEIKDRGTERDNREAAEALAQSWMREQGAKKYGSETALRFCPPAMPYVVASERPTEPDTAIEAKLPPPPPPAQKIAPLRA